MIFRVFFGQLFLALARRHEIKAHRAKTQAEKLFEAVKRAKQAK